MKEEYGEEDSDEEVCGNEESVEAIEEPIEIDGSGDEEIENEEAGADEDEDSVTNTAHC